MKDVERFMLYQVAKTEDARLYRNEQGAEMWIPRSVCPWVQKSGKTIARGDAGRDVGAPSMEQHFVEVERWWLKKHPWPKTAEGQLL